MNMTKDVLSPVFDTTANIGQNVISAVSDTWDCTCGNKGVVGKFCNMCGKKRPTEDTWNCTCGNKGNVGKFCNMCGKKRPTEDTWDCTCGNKGITGNFCSSCGKRKGE